jgi:4-amino-4-deoxy-L-arabinose transferase-like glycosyltransferase
MTASPLRDIPGRARRLLGTTIRLRPRLIVLCIILVMALDLRLQSVVHSIVETPVRADAREYVLYAHNLRQYGVYSHTDTLTPGPARVPVPDAKRTPGYPLFLSLFLGSPPELADIAAVTRVQALLSTATVLIAYWLARTLLAAPLALAATALVALSPHLVTMNIYLLSETLFTLLLTTAIWLIVASGKKSGPALPAAAGLMLGAAALTHPMLLYFVVPLAAFLFYGWREPSGRRTALIVIVFFGLVTGAWAGRNLHTLGQVGDSTLMAAALRSGAYRNLMYRDDPNTYAYPYRADPHYGETSRDAGSALAEVVREFREAPAAQLQWYLVGKPAILWSWANAEGQGDVFVYPVSISPYWFLPHFRASHAFMEGTHRIFVFLMALGIVIAWIPNRITGLTGSAAIGARILSLLLLYHAAVMISGFPLPRYTIPMRPFMYVIGMVPLATGFRLLRQRTGSVSTTTKEQTE